MVDTNPRPTWQTRGRRAVLGCLRPVDAIAQRLIRPRERRVLYVSEPDYSDSAFAVYRRLLESREGIEHVWLVRDLSMADRIRSEFARSNRPDHSLEVLPLRLRSYPAFLRCRVSFHTHGLYSFAPPGAGRTSVSLWHGMPVKAIRRLHKGNRVLFPVRGSFHVATSSFFRFIVAAAFGSDADDVVVSGLPRTDVLKGIAPPQHDRAAIADRIGLDADRPWLLWMPTHRSEPDFRGSRPARSFLDATDPALVQTLEDACREHGVQVIIKLHVLDVLNDEDVELSYETMSLITASRWQDLGIQLYDLVAASDGLVTDVSSIAIDYLHTRRPIGVLGFDPSTYTRELIFDPALLMRCSAVSSLSGPEEIRRFVERLVADDRSAVGEDDVSHVLNEDGDIDSTEHVLALVGL